MTVVKGEANKYTGQMGRTCALLYTPQCVYTHTRRTVEEKKNSAEDVTDDGEVNLFRVTLSLSSLSFLQTIFLSSFSLLCNPLLSPLLVVVISRNKLHTVNHTLDTHTHTNFQRNAVNTIFFGVAEFTYKNIHT